MSHRVSVRCKIFIRFRVNTWSLFDLCLVFSVKLRVRFRSRVTVRYQ